MNFFDPIPIANIASSLLAEQLTLYNWHLFSRITPTQLNSYLQGKECPDVVGSFICSFVLMEALLKWGLKFFTWVCADVMRFQLEERVKRLYYWIHVCDEFLKLGNFDSVAAIVEALSQSCITRLKKTWALLPKETGKKFEHIQTFFLPNSDYAAYRNFLSKHPEGKPYIPVLSIHWKDMRALKRRIKTERTLDDITKLFITCKRNKFTFTIDKALFLKFETPWEHIYEYSGYFDFWSEMCEYPSSEKHPPKQSKLKDVIDKLPRKATSFTAAKLEMVKQGPEKSIQKANSFSDFKKKFSSILVKK